VTDLVALHRFDDDAGARVLRGEPVEMSLQMRLDLPLRLLEKTEIPRVTRPAGGKADREQPAWERVEGRLVCPPSSACVLVRQGGPPPRARLLERALRSALPEATPGLIERLRTTAAVVPRISAAACARSSSPSGASSTEPAGLGRQRTGPATVRRSNKGDDRLVGIEHRRSSRVTASLARARETKQAPQRRFASRRRAQSV
jgi:hypothetical protein